MYLGNAVASGVVDLVEPLHQAGYAVVQGKLAEKQQKFLTKEAQKQAAFQIAEAQKDLALQMRAQSIKGPSLLPIILAGVGTVILLGGMVYLIARD